ncbi:hypothetical protein PVB08_22305 [Bacillus thuringiensis]
MEMTEKNLLRAVSALSKILGYQLTSDGRLINLSNGNVYDDIPEGEKLKAAIANGDVKKIRQILGVSSQPQ